jgi:hypothetical protein
MISFAVYYRSIPTLEEQLASINNAESLLKSKSNLTGNVHFRQKYNRIPFEIGPITVKICVSRLRTVQDIDCSLLSENVNARLDQFAEEIVQKTDCWFDEEIEPTIPISALLSKGRYLQNLPTSSKLKPEWKIRVSGKLWPAERDHWRLSLLLTNITETEKTQHPVALFSAQIKCQLEDARYVSVPFRAAALDYRYTTESWGRGINSVLRVSQEGSIAQTETMPIYEQVRIGSRFKIESACSSSFLSSDGFLDALSEVSDWLTNYADIWKENNKAYLGDETFELREKDLKVFEEEIRRYHFGIDALKRDKRLAKSFRLMNEVFSKSEHPSWWLFQLVFIVTQMTSLLARENKEADFLEELQKVDVLWFPTGGGKTEAYFGVIVTAMFFDRLRGKSRGVTAWLRYPLRMLSIQQLQRLVDVVAVADEIRKESDQQSLKECDPFAVGYYVGQKNTPNELTTYWEPYDEPIQNLKKEVERESDINENRLLVLQRCPYCRSNNIRVDVDTKALRIRHVCNSCQRESPIYISDSEIYRYVPIVIVGTVDRLARVGQTSYFSHLFGQFTHRCPEHGYLSFDKCIESPFCKVKKYQTLPELHDPCPTLLLQDELHLLKESLGTYASHYETFIDTLAESIGNGLPPKRFAATATIEGCDDHIWELYGRRSVRFPVKGMEENSSAYVEPSEKSPKSRVYVGIMPTGANTEEAVWSILKALKLYSDEEVNKQVWNESTIDNYDISLAYVNEKNTAGNLRAKWDDMDDIQVLTGDKGLGEVRAAIGRIESDIKKIFGERLKVIVATSVISHGVDLSRLNLMAFCGMPNHASDYIQASSRVGRSHLGLVFTVFRPANNRERNIYQRFYEYHDRLYQLVQPVPINRFSESSIRRTLPGILSACILNILAYRRYSITGTSFDKADHFIKALVDGIVTDDDLISLVRDSLAIDKLNLPGTTIESFDRLIARLVKDERRIICTQENFKTFLRMKPPPVSSLREVSEQIEFLPSPKCSFLVQKVLEGRDD